MKKATSRQRLSAWKIVSKSLRHILSLGLAFSLLLTLPFGAGFGNRFFLNAYAGDGNSDGGVEPLQNVVGSNPITNISFELNKDVYTIGDTVTLIFQFENPFSLMSNGAIWIMFSNEGRVATFFNPFVQVNATTWSTKMHIENGTNSGVYSVSGFVISDGNTQYNYQSEESDPNNGVDLSATAFNVGGTEGDLNPPILNSIQVRSQEYTISDDVYFDVSVSDVHAPVYLELYYSTNEMSESQLFASCWIETTGNQVCNNRISPYAPSGIWVLNHIILQDSSTLSNRVTIYNESMYPNEANTMNFDTNTFNVTGTLSDTTAPVLSSLVLSSSSFHINETLRVKLNVEDDLSGFGYGMISYVNRNDNSTYHEWVDAYYMQSQINLEMRGASVGRYSIGSIELHDNIGNWVVYYNQELFTQSQIGSEGVLYDFSDYDFEVLERSVEDVSSWFFDQTVSPQVAKLGVNIHVLLKVGSELTNVGSFRVYYNQKYGFEGEDHAMRNTYIDLTNQGDGTFAGDYSYLSDTLGDYIPLYLEYMVDGNTVRVSDLRNVQTIRVADLSGLGFSIESNTEIDTTPPILDSFSVDNPFPNVGDEVHFQFSGHDDESGICRFVLNYRVDGQLISDQNYYFYDDILYDPNPFRRMIDIYEYAGLWEIDSMYIESYTSSTVIYNQKYYPDDVSGFNFDEASFTVSNTTEDHVAPILNSIEIDRNSLYPNEQLTISATFADDVSGVGYISAEFYNVFGDALYVPIELDGPTSGSYTFTIPSLTRPGEWRLEAITLYDYAGNRAGYGNLYGYQKYCEYNMDYKCIDYSRFDLDILGTLDDTEGPNLQSVSTEFDVYINNSFANVSLAASDVSSVKDISLYYITPMGLRRFSIGYSSWNPEVFDTQIAIPMYGSVGSWSLQRVRMTDIYGNVTDYRDSAYTDISQNLMNLSAGDFTVIGPDSLPVIEAIRVDRLYATIDEEVEVTIQLGDEIVAPDSIDVNFVSVANLQRRTITLIKQADGFYRGRFYVSAYDDASIWEVDYLNFSDRYGTEFYIQNQAKYPENPEAQSLQGATFEIYGTTTDINAPEITNVFLEGTENGTINVADSRTTTFALLSSMTSREVQPISAYVPNDRIRYVIEASDDVSGLNQVIVTYQIYKKNISFTIPVTEFESGKYSGEVDIQSYFPAGNWTLIYFEASDSAGNKYIQTKEEIQAGGTQIGLNRLQFSIDNAFEDTQAPVLQSLTLSKKLLKGEDVLYFSATATDDFAGIDTFQLIVAPYDYQYLGVQQTVEMLKMDDGTYQGELHVTENTIGATWGIKDILIRDRADNKYVAHNLLMYSNYVPNKQILNQYDFQIDYLVSATLIQAPNKLVYNVGDEIDLTGLIILGKFSDGSEKPLSISKQQVFEFNSSVATELQYVYVLVGNTYISFHVTITDQVDTVPPVITLSEYEKGWTNESICVYATVNEGSLNASEHCFHENESFEFVAVDEVGNESRQTVIIDNIDKTLPTISVSQDLKFTLNSIGSIPYLAFDLESGLIGEGSRSIHIDTTKIGRYTTSISVTDQARNQRVEEIRYQVVYDFLGFQQPINTNGTSIFKAGSTIPIKFKLGDALGMIQGNAIASLTVTQLSSNVEGVVNELPINISASSTAYFRYDEQSGQYILNLSTKGYPAGRYRLSVNLDDGTCHSIEIGLKK